MKLLKTRKDTEMCQKMRIASCINGIALVLESLLTFLIGILYINNTINMLEKCSLAKNFYIDPALKPCLTICARGDDSSIFIGT